MQLHELKRTPAQIGALRELCEMWHLGPERFWSFDSVLEAMSRPGSIVVFAADDADANTWAGAALVDVGPYAADLLYIYIRPDYRKQGLAGRLLNEVFRILATKAQIEAMFLEVRVSNVDAQRLYKNLGMSLIGTRKKYYADGEDALIFKIVFPRMAVEGKNS